MRIRTKFLLVGLLFLLVWPSVGFTGNIVGMPGRFLPVLESIEINGSSFTSDIVYIGDAQGIFSLQYDISGGGTVKLEYLISLDETNYIEPSSASDIATGLTASSGPGGDGQDIVSFTPILGEYLKIRATESDASATTVTVYLGRQ